MNKASIWEVAQYHELYSAVRHSQYFYFWVSCRDSDLLSQSRDGVMDSSTPNDAETRTNL